MEGITGPQEISTQRPQTARSSCWPKKFSTRVQKPRGRGQKSGMHGHACMHGWTIEAHMLPRQESRNLLVLGLFGVQTPCSWRTETPKRNTSSRVGRWKTALRQGSHRSVVRSAVDLVSHRAGQKGKSGRKLAHRRRSGPTRRKILFQRSMCSGSMLIFRGVPLGSEPATSVYPHVLQNQRPTPTDHHTSGHQC